MILSISVDGEQSRKIRTVLNGFTFQKYHACGVCVESCRYHHVAAKVNGPFERPLVVLMPSG